jgi:putative autoinducer-2 (AI-2) aldolase
MLAIDHGYFLGPTSKLEKPGKTVAPLVEYADAIMPTRGVVRQCLDPAMNKPLVLRVSGGNSVISDDLSNEALMVSVEDAVRINASAVAFSIYVGAKNEHQTLREFSHMVNDCERFGMPALAVTAVGKELEKRDARYLALASRIAAELGAHFVKTYYCENFEKVVESCPVPIVIAGGPKMETEMDVLKTVHDAISAGACGVDMGRNVWQNPHPVAMIKAIRSIVHEKHTAKEALALYEKEKGKK